MAAPICRRANICRTPTALAGDGAVAAVTSQPYAIVTNPNRPTVDTSTLGLSSAKQVESSPTSYTGIAGSSQGNCQPIPASSGTASTYYDSCQIGTAEADSNFTCTIGWANQFTSAYQYTCHTSEWDIYNPNTGGTFFWGIRLRQLCQPVFLHAGQPDQEALGHDLAARRRARMVFTETDTTYNCSAQTNLGPARRTYCINHDLVLRAAAAGSGAGRARRCLCRANPDLSGLHSR
jgi:conjugal transfer mating pair stabilization protein TraN